jgi:hypothetical protein
MAEEEATTKTKDKKEESKPEPVPPLPDLDRLSKSDLAELERRIEDRLQKVHTEHSKEREELRHDLEEVREWKAEQEKAQHDRDKVKDSTGTMVLPPTDIPPQQPNPQPQQEHITEEGKKQSRWKSIW